jgi:serine/threonine protein kinase
VLSCKGEAMADLNNEVRLLSCVRAPNIVQLVETFIDAEQFYLVMEKVEGGELFDVLATVSHYSEQESRDAFRQIMEALIILRHHHVVHRDLVRFDFISSFLLLTRFAETGKRFTDCAESQFANQTC